MPKIKYIANVIKWFDKVNGNTYHSVRITNCENNNMLYAEFQYGYGEQYKYSIFKKMVENKWINKKYNMDNIYLYERENDYPIYWNVTDGLKRECVANGKC